ncbi:hypothetical protein [Nocardia sp. NRRL S-836]|uniref:LppU/SCO3897 family protein n=1 Tax=Nocardia sp. NRRL S-836 TaxID=1519492 RepID=UPI0006AF89A4|nr:hypothetical protein [Nocardia sp. NRRL S-836]KOV89789.1 hypothetical protein ADL03_03265 [Nocardia sp. NRRL S-836]
MKKVGLGIGVVFLVVGGVLVLDQVRSGGGVQVGDCARISGTQDNPTYQALGCDEGAANVKVAKVLARNEDRCPTGGMAYSVYTGSVSYCLMPNFREGACYGQDQEAGIALVACTTKDSVKVVKVLTGKTDRTACGDARPAVFPEPATTFCLERGDKQQ